MFACVYVCAQTYSVVHDPNAVLAAAIPKARPGHVREDSLSLSVRKIITEGKTSVINDASVNCDHKRDHGHRHRHSHSHEVFILKNACHAFYAFYALGVLCWIAHHHHHHHCVLHTSSRERRDGWRGVRQEQHSYVFQGFMRSMPLCVLCVLCV